MASFINGSKFKHDLLKIAEDGDQGSLQGDNPIVVKDDRTQTPVVQTRVYAKRWYILAVFSLLALYQCCIWNTWGPVVDVLTVVYPDWTQATVSLLANWCSIAFLIFMLPVLYLQNNNLRYSILLTSSFIAVGKNALRLILTAKMCFELIFI